MEVTPRIELGNRGFADLGLTAWLCHQYMIKDTRQKNGAENETRTRDPHLGKVMLYQLSYFRILSFVSAAPRVTDKEYNTTFPSACQHFFYIFLKNF